MNQNFAQKKAPENINFSTENPATISAKEKDVSHGKEVKEVSDKFAGVAQLETLRADESAEVAEAMGHVSENVGDVREQKGDGIKAGGAAQAVTITDIRASLLKNLPSEKEMRKQIEKEIKKEISYLHSKAMKMLRNPGEISYFEMNNLVRKIRELKSLLLALLKSSFEHLKTLWLRFVHGIM